MGFKFEKLKVWEKAIDLSGDIHELAKKIPKDEIYILSAQIKRAADSVALNIAEGSTGQSNVEFKRFINYAIRSAIEVVSCLYIGKKRDLINNKNFTVIYDKTEELVKMLQALKKTLIKV